MKLGSLVAVFLFMFLFLFLFRGCFAVLPPSHEGRVVYVTQAGQGVMINYGSAPHISPLRSLRLTVSVHVHVHVPARSPPH